MKQIRIVGVPEHFNLPWHMAIEEGAFAERGIDLQWTDIPEGTGKMCQMLQNGDTDLAIILTEGVVKSICDGNPARILQEYIASPLLWGVHVGHKSRFKAISDLNNSKAAISRFGSGSHLMAYVNAQNQGWDTAALNFEVVDNLNNAVKALTQGSADYFMWERFTTKPLVDQGVFRRLDDCPTPWPCFVIAAPLASIEAHRHALAHILEVINTYTSEIRAIPSIDRTLANRYGQQLDDIRKWLSLTYWSQSQLGQQNLQKVQTTLLELGLISNKKDISEILQNVEI